MKTDFPYSLQWLRPFVSILLAFVGLMLTLSRHTLAPNSFHPPHVCPFFRTTLLPQTPNRSTIAEVGLAQHGLCVGFAPHESLSLSLDRTRQRTSGLLYRWRTSMIESVAVSSRCRTVTRSSSMGRFDKEGSYDHCK